MSRKSDVRLSNIPKALIDRFIGLTFLYLLDCCCTKSLYFCAFLSAFVLRLDSKPTVNSKM